MSGESLHVRRDGLPAHLHGPRRAHRRFAGMPALHATVTAATLTDVHVEPAHDRLDGRQIFLILRGDMRLAHRLATGWAGRRQAEVVCFVHHRRHRTVPLAPTGTPD